MGVRNSSMEDAGRLCWVMSEGQGARQGFPARLRQASLHQEVLALPPPGSTAENRYQPLTVTSPGSQDVQAGGHVAPRPCFICRVEVPRAGIQWEVQRPLLSRPAAVSTPAAALWTWSVSAKAGRLGLAPSAWHSSLCSPWGRKEFHVWSWLWSSLLNLLPVSSISCTSSMDARVSVETGARQATGKVPLTVRK